MMYTNPINDAFNILNKKNIKDLWCTSTFLSCVDVLDRSVGDSYNIFMPALNEQKLAMYSKLIIKSNANNYKEEKLSGEEYGKVSNVMSDILDYETPTTDVEVDEAYIKNILFRGGNSQIRFQSGSFAKNIGKVYALLSFYPHKYREELQKLLQDRFIDIDNVLTDKFNLNVFDFLHISDVLINEYFEYYHKNFEINDRVKNEILSTGNDQRSKTAWKFLTSFIDYFKSHYQSFIITNPDTEQDNEVLPKKTFQAFLDLTSKTKKEFQDIYRTIKEFSMGDFSVQVSPLERFPLTNLDNGEYIIPNIRFYLASIPNFLHYTLQDLFGGNEYNNMMGFVQEYYLSDLFKNRIPDFSLIPETTYKRRRSDVKGPDFILKDRNDRLILIESKSKRFSAKSRVEIDNEAIGTDLSRLFDALKKLPKKFDELFEDKPEYKKYRDILNDGKDSKPLFVIVAYGGLEFMPAIVCEYLRKNSDHFINSNFSYSFCIIELDDFEYAVEVCANNLELHLSDLLEDYWEASKEFISKDGNIFKLRSYQIDTEKSFALNFYKRLRERMVALRKQQHDSK